MFISSTYEDLKDERSAVEQVLLSCDCMPIGMERFPSSNKEQFEYIKSIIEFIDYYLLIIGGRYGSLNEDTGISYTEMEYDYAVEKEVPVLVFIKNSSAITKDKMDKNQDKLEKFIKKATKNRLRSKTFENQDQLKIHVMHSITSEKIVSPRPGWIRANFGNPTELLYKITQLTEENIELKERIENSLYINFEIFEGDFELELDCFMEYRQFTRAINDEEFIKKLTVEISTKDLFKTISDMFFRKGDFQISDINLVIKELYKNLYPSKYYELNSLSDETFFDMFKSKEKVNIKSSDPISRRIFLKTEYKGLKISLNNKSEGDLIRFLMLNKLILKDNQSYKLTELGEAAYKKMI